MTLKQVREELAAIREEVEREVAPEWIGVSAPDCLSDEDLKEWLAFKLGEGWERHNIIVHGNSGTGAPSITTRRRDHDHVEGFYLRLSASEVALA